MILRKVKPYFVEIIISCSILVISIGAYFVTQYFLINDNYELNNLKYVSKEILNNNIAQVINESKNNKELIKPYSESDISIVKDFYDYQKEDNENSIVYYENTYLQNTGIDFAKKEPFNVLSVLDGTILSVTEDEITGKTVKIEHDNNIISVYQSISDVTVSKGDKVAQGQVIGKSGINEINKDLGNHLHFELYINNILVNPNKYFNMIVGE